MENRDFIRKGKVGKAEYGYIKEKGKRNVWAAVCPLGGVYEARENNLNSAAKLARELEG